jgi:ribosome silencing factor RsfS/YbeB/iojap
MHGRCITVCHPIVGYCLERCRSVKVESRQASDDWEEEEEEYEAVLGEPSALIQDNAEDDAKSREFALAMAKVAWDLKGEDILLLHVAPVVYWTRYMVIVTVFSRPQLNAVLGKIEKTAFEEFDVRPSASPSAKSSWELLDFGDTVIHVLTAGEREYYDLESFYAAADEVPLPFDDEMEQKNLDWRSKM